MDEHGGDSVWTCELIDNDFSSREDSEGNARSGGIDPILCDGPTVSDVSEETLDELQSADQTHLLDDAPAQK